MEFVFVYDFDGDFLIYFIISGNIGNKFLIDKVRGEVIIVNKFDYEEVSFYILII